jgi:3-hydroxyacyl-CoA dehydrogenase/enoyl-CoA hydratase/3-hydroxybutyryl-CoA epimerase
MGEDEAAEVLARIHSTAQYTLLADVQLVIEAVFEDRAVKAEVTRRAEAAMPADAIFASNTSTLPITGLAEASARPTQFIGIHFFSPVDKMPLVEVIRGRQTSGRGTGLCQGAEEDPHRGERRPGLLHHAICQHLHP